MSPSSSCLWEGVRGLCRVVTVVFRSVGRTAGGMFDTGGLPVADNSPQAVAPALGRAAADIAAGSL